MTGYKVSQDELEITSMLSAVSSKFGGGAIESYLEIGSYAGESLLYVSKHLKQGALVVLVDLGDNEAARTALQKTIKTLENRFDIVLISGDSTDPFVINRVVDMCPSLRYDLCLIDGNHDFDFVVKDLAHYGSVSTWIALHDIDPRAIKKNIAKHGYEKPSAAHVWRVLRLSRHVEEFINPACEDKPKGLGLVAGISIGK